MEQLEDRCLLSTLQAISVPDPNQPPSDTAAGVSSVPAVSAGGRYVAFQSTASNLVPGEIANVRGSSNVFLLDRFAGVITLVSHAPGSSPQALTTAEQGFRPGQSRLSV